MAALLGSKMPLSEASAVLQRLTGVALPRATLDREAQRQGERAEAKRAELDLALPTAEGARSQSRGPTPAPFTLVIEIDAWNIRERDDWGQSARQRVQGREPPRWHWVYGATCFRLEDRVQKGQRAIILSRGTVMTRGGTGRAAAAVVGRGEAARAGPGRARASSGRRGGLDLEPGDGPV